MKVLVTAASKHGTTAEIAEEIAKVLRAAQLEVDVIPPDDVQTIVDYDAVVLGSGVYAGHWMQPARAFAERHAVALQETTVFLFSSGPIGDPPRPLEDPAEIAWIDEATMALDHRVFAGRLTESDLGAGRAADHQDGPGAVRRLPVLGRHHGLGYRDRELRQGRGGRARRRRLIVRRQSCGRARPSGSTRPDRPSHHPSRWKATPMRSVEPPITGIRSLICLGR